MDVYLQEYSSDTVQQYAKGATLIKEGQNQEGVEILLKLYNEQKVQII